MLPPRLAGFGGKGIRTPDFQLAKLALYQLSYAPAGIAECRLAICDCKRQRKCRRAIARHPASSHDIAAKTELCVTVSEFFKPWFLSIPRA
jgi:hypothetical protein